jgi:putative isomerase
MDPETALDLLKNRITLDRIPFTERGSRLMVLRHNHALAIRLAERWLKVDHRLSAYRERPSTIDDLCFTDGEGLAVEFEIETHADRLDIRTPVGGFSLCFVDPETIYIALPPGACGLRFMAHVEGGRTDQRGGVLHVTGKIKRNIAYTSDRQELHNSIQQAGPDLFQVSIQYDAGAETGLLLNLTPRLGFNRYIPEREGVFRAARKRWRDWFSAVPDVAEPYRAQYVYAWWVMRAGLISTRFYTTREAMTSSKLHYVGVWQWDAYFHALAYQHVDMRLAQDQLRVVLDHQRTDGMLPDAVHDEGIVDHLDIPVDADVTKPPLTAWAAWKLYQKSADIEFLREVYEPIVRSTRWWLERNDLDKNGLCEYQHPYSSGLDDSPLWDTGMPVTSPDLNTYLVVQMQTLSSIAHVLGHEGEAARWLAQADEMLERMNQLLWDENTGLYWAWWGGRWLKVRTPFSIIPLLTGKLPSKISSQLVSHLSDPQEFWSENPLPSVALNDPNYSPDQMWRGPVWVNVNYLLVEGLERSGYPLLARQLRKRTLAMLNNSNDFYEYYHPETGEPGTKAASIFGWSAALFIDMAIRESRDSEENQE